jgi:P2-related tail formation protein
VDAVDLDVNYTELMNQAVRHLNFSQLKVHTQNVSEWIEPADVVNALSLIHWIFSCTAVMGNMEAMIQFFRNLTRNILVIEWIDPEDEAIKYFNHLDYNVNFSDESYNRESFVTSLEDKFNDVKSLGYTRKPTRELFIAKV